jgi:LysR family glycine cleavage system transcriptional activator
VPSRPLRAFEAAARLLSFTKAARELNVTPAAVSHQIRALELYLEVPLFHRTTRSPNLTEQGQIAAEQLTEGFDRIARGVEILRDKRGGGTLTVSATPSFATRWLVPRLNRFVKRFPGVSLRIKASTAAVDFEQDETDAAIRLGRGGLEGVTALELFGETLAPLASPAFIKAHTLRRPADLAKVPLLHDDSMRRSGRPPGWFEWFRAAGAGGLARPKSARDLHFDDGNLVLQAACTECGVALGRIAYAAEDIAAGRLRVVCQPALPMDLRYFLLIPESRVELSTVAGFRSWLLSEAAEFERSMQAMLKQRAPGVAHRPAAR